MSGYSIYEHTEMDVARIKADAIEEMLNHLQDPNYPPMMFDEDSIKEYADQLREQAREQALDKLTAVGQEMGDYDALDEERNDLHSKPV